MAEQKSRGARGVRKRGGAATEQVRGGARKAAQGAGSTAAKTAKGATDAPGEVADQVKGSDEQSDGGSDRKGGESQTMREELGSIVRETAVEVLGPVLRSATKSAAKYAIRKAPEMAIGRALPKLRELQSSVQEAGGPGAFARETLGSGSEGDEGGGALSRLKQLGRGDEDSEKASERVPEQESVDVAAPLETVYEQFTQLDDFAELLSGGDIVDEQENERIVWTNEGEGATAVVTFHRLDDRLTRVMISYDHEAQNFAAKALSALHTRRRGLRSDLARFKALVEMNELEREDGDGAASDGDQDEPQGSQEESEDEEYEDEEPYEGEDEPEAESGEIVDSDEEDEPEAESDEIVDAEEEDEPEGEGEDEPEAESDSEPEQEPEPKPRRQAARKRAPRRRAPAKPRKSSRARSA
jgi:hypothetical protein